MIRKFQLLVWGVTFLFYSGFTLGQNTENIVEKMAEFPGGQEAMMSFIAENLVYPDSAKNNFSCGKFKLKLIVDTTGKAKIADYDNINDPMLKRSIDQVMDQMPVWSPATQRGKRVPMVFGLPLSFKLEGVKENKRIKHDSKLARFEHHKSADVTYNDSVIRVDGKAAGGDIVMKTVPSDYEGFNEILRVKDGLNGSIANVYVFEVNVNGYPANMVSAEIFLHSDPLNLGPMVLKVYKIQLENITVAVIITDFESDLKKNHDQNATVMKTLEISDI